MNAGQAERQRRGSRPLLLAKLVAAVRVEFRSDLLAFAPTDPVFGGGACRVGDCERSARGHGLCPGHRQRWSDEGRPDVDVFAAATDRRWRRQRPNMVCQIQRCGYGSARGGLCVLHGQRWTRAGRPDLAGWLADPPPVKQPCDGAVCRVEHCDLWPDAAHPLCHSHFNTWRVNGRPDLDTFVAGYARVALPADESIRLATLGGQLRLELHWRVGYPFAVALMVAAGLALHRVFHRVSCLNPTSPSGSEG